eukprot:TRINITY_DN87559_c0_g1_i6.p1 TRINITY_DN87559_c0_g1~~TRINITY_DN87559_c0_g1_i6.p1  ORF type:complete len:232 (-),score=-18.36 TRINITY_DN87559_c0_g1_i6:80-775(-)
MVKNTLTNFYPSYQQYFSKEHSTLIFQGVLSYNVPNIQPKLQYYPLNILLLFIVVRFRVQLYSCVKILPITIIQPISIPLYKIKNAISFFFSFFKEHLRKTLVKTSIFFTFSTQNNIYLCQLCIVIQNIQQNYRKKKISPQFYYNTQLCAKVQLSLQELILTTRRQMLLIQRVNYGSIYNFLLFDKQNQQKPLKTKQSIISTTKPLPLPYPQSTNYIILQLYLYIYLYNRI